MPLNLRPLTSDLGPPPSALRPPPTVPTVALLTGGGDKPYALGMAAALREAGIPIDFIGSNDLDVPELYGSPLIRFLNLRGDQSPEAGAVTKLKRVFLYYLRLLRYALTAKPKVFHILWHNKFDFIDRTLVMGFYRLLCKRLVFTAHNVNAGKRDGRDTFWNRLSLKSQYSLADHVFVHTEMMKQELMKEFQVAGSKISVIPFGINNTVPNTTLTGAEARRGLGLAANDKVLLFFGNIAPYKGVELLANAFARIAPLDSAYRLVIAGRPKGSESYWAEIEQHLQQSGLRNRIITNVNYIPDEQVEIYFKVADLLVLPYRHIFQSGVLFLGYSFGLPVLATDVGSLKEEIIIGKTGLVCAPDDPESLAAGIQQYFTSDLFRELPARRAEIRQHANDRYSWSKVAAITGNVYSQLAR